MKEGLIDLPQPTYDAHTAAAWLRVSGSWVVKLAKKHGIGRIINQAYAFTSGDLRHLDRLIQAGRVGRPAQRKD